MGSATRTFGLVLIGTVQKWARILFANGNGARVNACHDCLVFTPVANSDAKGGDRNGFAAKSFSPAVATRTSRMNEGVCLDTPWAFAAIERSCSCVSASRKGGVEPGRD